MFKRYYLSDSPQINIFAIGILFYVFFRYTKSRSKTFCVKMVHVYCPNIINPTPTTNIICAFFHNKKAIIAYPHVNRQTLSHFVQLLSGNNLIQYVFL